VQRIKESGLGCGWKILHVMMESNSEPTKWLPKLLRSVLVFTRDRLALWNIASCGKNVKPGCKL